jgi:ribonuclease HI
MNAFQMIMKASQTQASQKSEEKKTESGYSIIKGTEKKESKCHLLQFDGLSQPNPGTSTAGAVLFSPIITETQRAPIFERGEFMNYATNNQAEYTGLLIGLKSAKELQIKNLLIEGDSQLVINQVQGKWKVSNDSLKVLNKEILELLKDFDFVAIRHVYRNSNKYADKITNDVLESKQSYFKTT